MSRVDFDELVESLQRRYSGRRRALAWHTAAVAAVGYVGFLLWVLLIAAAGIGCFVGALWAPPEVGPWLIVAGAIVLAVAVWQAAMVLWLPASPEKSLVIGAHEVPELFRLLARLRRALRAAKIHRVALTPELNAGICQQPRWGIFGWSENRLDLGLPLMELLTPVEFEAVLAHEYAHLSARHGRFNRWIYRIRGTWMQLFVSLQQPTTSSFTRALRRGLTWFLDGYWPRVHAYFFLTSRAHELATDRCAADVAGPDTVAAALWKINLCGRRLDRQFWVETWRQANVQQEPPTDICQRIAHFMTSPPDEQDAARWIEPARRSLTDNADTHPSLAERLAALGVSVDQVAETGYPAAPHPSAAQQLLGARLDGLRDAVNRQWREAIRPNWHAQRHRADMLRRRIADHPFAVDSPTDSSLSEDKILVQRGASLPATNNLYRLWESVRAQVGLDGPAAEPLLREFLAVWPAHVPANLSLGQLLLGQGRGEGEQFLQRVLSDRDGDKFAEACQALAEHYRETGQAEQWARTRAALRARVAAQAEADQERQSVTARDTFRPVDPSLPEIAELQAVLAAEPELFDAYLAAKQLKHFPDKPLYVLCVRSRKGVGAGFQATRDLDLIQRLQPRVRLAGRVLIIAPQGGFRSLARKLIALRGAQVYPRGNCGLPAAAVIDKMPAHPRLDR